MWQNANNLRIEESKKRLGLAKTFLRLANKHTKQEADFRGAVDLGYNSAEHCFKAFILLKHETLPSKHSGVVQRFSELYIKTKELDKEYAARARKALKFRNLARYDADAYIGKMMVGEVMRLAEDLIVLLEQRTEKV